MQDVRAYLPSFGDCIGLLVFVGTHSKVLDSLTGVPLASQQDGVGTGRCSQSKLVQSQDFTTGLEDTLLGSLGETEGCDGEFGDIEYPDVVGDRSDVYDDFRFAVGGTGSFLDDFGQRERRSVGFGEI